MDGHLTDARLRIFQHNGCSLEVVKQTDTVTRQERGQVDVGFVEQPRVVKTLVCALDT